jgi:hypothetical protein
MERFSQPSDPTHAVNRLVFPVFDQAGEAFVRREAALAAFQGLIAVARFKAEKGRYPETLAEAGFKATDPFSGGPFRMRVSEGQARVYSVGSDRTDDGGEDRATDPDGNPLRRDVVCVFPRR